VAGADFGGDSRQKRTGRSSIAIVPIVRASRLAKRFPSIVRWRRAREWSEKALNRPPCPLPYHHFALAAINTDNADAPVRVGALQFSAEVWRNPSQREAEVINGPAAVRQLPLQGQRRLR
jgi:hypothetical protein